MKYMGSKRRIAKYILPIILANRKENQYYVEPFVGGCNMMEHVTGLRIGSDNNKYLISLWNALCNGRTFEKSIPREIYNSAREEFKKGTNVMFDDSEIGWIGWMGSFNGRFFDGGYSGKSYIDGQIKNTLSQLKKLDGVEFIYSDYYSLYIPQNSIIYCDIPYKGTKQYVTSRNFDYEKFYEWCRLQSGLGNTVFLSEYQAPSDFEIVWEMDIKNSMHQTKTKITRERLFKI